VSSRVVQKLKRTARLSPLEWRYLVIALKELFLARIRHAVRPAEDILRDLQAGQPRSPTGGTEEIDLARLSWALGAAATRVPWRSDCLLRAMAAERWLRRHRREPEFFLGTTKLETGQFEAHAWLRCGDVMVTAGRSEEFAELIAPPARQARTRA
jgi:hypothetical protein